MIHCMYRLYTIIHVHALNVRWYMQRADEMNERKEPSLYPFYFATRGVSVMEFFDYFDILALARRNDERNASSSLVKVHTHLKAC